MSVEAMAVVLNHSQAKGTARLVLLGIANHDGDGGAWPSNATLCRYAGGVDETTVRRAIAKLVELGELRVELQRGGTPETPDEFRPNRYSVLLRCPGDCDRTTSHRTARQLRLVRGPGRPPKNRGALVPPGGADAPGGGCTHAPGGGAPTPPEPPKEPTREPGVGLSTTERDTACGQVMPHSCDGGWLDEDHTTPCLLCKPHLARKVRRTS